MYFLFFFEDRILFLRGYYSRNFLIDINDIYYFLLSCKRTYLTVGIITLNVACVAVNNVYDITKLSINDTRNT